MAAWPPGLSLVRDVALLELEAGFSVAVLPMVAYDRVRERLKARRARLCRIAES